MESWRNSFQIKYCFEGSSRLYWDKNVIYRWWPGEIFQYRETFCGTGKVYRPYDILNYMQYCFSTNHNIHKCIGMPVNSMNRKRCIYYNHNFVWHNFFYKNFWFNWFSIFAVNFLILTNQKEVKVSLFSVVAQIAD